MKHILIIITIFILSGCNSANGKKRTYNDFVPGRDEYWKTLKEDQESKNLSQHKKEESLQAELETLKLEKEKLIAQNKESIKKKSEETTMKNNIYYYPFNSKELTFNENLEKPNNKIQQFERNEKYYQIISNQESYSSPKMIVEEVKNLKNEKYKDLGTSKKEFETTNEYTLYQSYLEYNFRKEAIFHKDFSIEFKDIDYDYNADSQNLMIHLPNSLVYDKASKVIVNNKSYYEDTGYKVGEQVVTKKRNEEKLYETTTYKVKFSDKETILSLKVHPLTYKKYFYEKKEKVTAKYVYSIDFYKNVLARKENINPLIKEYYLPTTIKYIEVYYDGYLIDSLYLN